MGAAQAVTTPQRMPSQPMAGDSKRATALPQLRPCNQVVNWLLIPQASSTEAGSLRHILSEKTA
jgi:hypothetical protein